MTRACSGLNSEDPKGSRRRDCAGVNAAEDMPQYGIHSAEHRVPYHAAPYQKVCVPTSRAKVPLICVLLLLLLT